MKCIVIGLGNYGSELAVKLANLENEVIGVDLNETRIEQIKDRIATAFIINAADEMALSVLPLDDIDLVIVAIGEDLEASIRTIALLKKNRVKHIYARAIDELHKTILEAFQLDKILMPEKDAAQDLVQLLDFGTNIESFQIDKDYYVIKFEVPLVWVGKRVDELKLKENFHIETISLKRQYVVTNFLGIPINENKAELIISTDYALQEGDELVCYGRYKEFSSLFKSLKIGIA